MGEREIYIEDNGEILEKEVTVSPKDKVIWLPRTAGNKISIFFADDVPFNPFLEPKWSNKRETNEDEIDGKVKGHRKGTKTTYTYNTVEFLLDPTTSDPVLIVDGGEPLKSKKKPKKAKTAKKAKTVKKAKKVKKVKNVKTVKKATRAKATKGMKRKKAAKSRASRKR
jgi:hypothetical protein